MDQQHPHLHHPTTTTKTNDDHRADQSTEKHPSIPYGVDVYLPKVNPCGPCWVLHSHGGIVMGVRVWHRDEDIVMGVIVRNLPRLVSSSSTLINRLDSMTFRMNRRKTKKKGTHTMIRIFVVWKVKKLWTVGLEWGIWGRLLDPTLWMVIMVEWERGEGGVVRVIIIMGMEMGIIMVLVVVVENVVSIHSVVSSQPVVEGVWLPLLPRMVVTFSTTISLLPTPFFTGLEWRRYDDVVQYSFLLPLQRLVVCWLVFIFLPPLMRILRHWKCLAMRGQNCSNLLNRLISTVRQPSYIPPMVDESVKSFARIICVALIRLRMDTAAAEMNRRIVEFMVGVRCWLIVLKGRCNQAKPKIKYRKGKH